MITTDPQAFIGCTIMSEMRARPPKTSGPHAKLPFILNLIGSRAGRMEGSRGGCMPIFRRYAFTSSSFRHR